VVAEMRQLSSQSAETSTNMAKKVQSINDAMAKFYGEEQEMENIEAGHVSRAETIIEDVMERFNMVTVDMEGSINVRESESRHIRDDISSALVAMQFQDRVSQIMGHVADNIDALNELIEAGVRNLDADTWLGEMEGKFSIEEEYANLSGEQASSVNPGLLTIF
jgi:methyl-accepting chemotaxis protein